MRNALIPSLLTLTVLSTIAAAGCAGSASSDALSQSTSALSADLVISQVYGAGGLKDAKYKQDYVEIFNRSSAAVSLNGKSIQYASSTATFKTSDKKVDLPNVTLNAGQYYLVQFGPKTSSVGVDLSPAADKLADNSIDLAASAGKVAIVGSTTLLDCGSAAARCSASQVIDLFGYGATATDYEGLPFSATSDNTKAYTRLGFGCFETDINLVNFEYAEAAPRSTATAVRDCTGVVVDASTDVNLPDTNVPDTGADTAVPVDAGPKDTGVVKDSSTPKDSGSSVDSGEEEEDADVEEEDDASSSTDAGKDAGKKKDAGVVASSDDDSGCSAGPRSTEGGSLLGVSTGLFVFLAMVGRRRRAK